MAIKDRFDHWIVDEPIDHAVPVSAPSPRRRESAEQALERPKADSARKLFGPANTQRVGLADLQKPGLQDAEQPALEAGGHMPRKHFECHTRMGELACERSVGAERRHEHDTGVGNRVEHRSEHARAKHAARRCAVRNAPEETWRHFLSREERRPADRRTASACRGPRRL